jgi:hypothetical protein
MRADMNFQNTAEGETGASSGEGQLSAEKLRTFLQHGDDLDDRKLGDRKLDDHALENRD